jgi:hypothetical protein
MKAIFHEIIYFGTEIGMRFVTTLESMPDKVTNQFDWTSLAEI